MNGISNSSFEQQQLGCFVIGLSHRALYQETLNDFYIAIVISLVKKMLQHPLSGVKKKWVKAALCHFRPHIFQLSVITQRRSAAHPHLN